MSNDKYHTPTRTKAIKAYGENEVGLKAGEPTLLEKTMLGARIDKNGETVYLTDKQKRMKLTDEQRAMLVTDGALTAEELKVKYGGDDGEHPAVKRKHFEIDRKLMFGEPTYWRYVETVVSFIRLVLLRD